MEIALMKRFDIRQNLIVPNITHMSRTKLTFECDLLILSNSNYATGVEIKVSKGDLKNDLKKSHIKCLDHDLFNNIKPTEFWFKEFKYFYYAVPEELKQDALDQIPDFCGLLIAERYIDWEKKERISIREIKNPTFLFNTKWTDKDKYEAARLGSMRILKLKEKIVGSNNVNNIKILATVKFELRNDSGIIRVECNKDDTNKTIIHEA